MFSCLAADGYLQRDVGLFCFLKQYCSRGLWDVKCVLMMAHLIFQLVERMAGSFCVSQNVHVRINSEVHVPWKCRPCSPCHLIASRGFFMCRITSSPCPNSFIYYEFCTHSKIQLLRITMVMEHGCPDFALCSIFFLFHALASWS